jgi:hypothetical protein
MPVDPNMLAASGGYVVADVRGRIVGRVEQAHLSAGSEPRLTVGSRLPWRRRRVVLASDIEAVDAETEVVTLRVGRDELREP